MAAEGWDIELFEALGWKFGDPTVAWNKERYVVVGGRCPACVQWHTPCIRLVDSKQADCLTCSQAHSPCAA